MNVITAVYGGTLLEHGLQHTNLTSQFLSLIDPHGFSLLESVTKVGNNWMMEAYYKIIDKIEPLEGTIVIDSFFYANCLIYLDDSEEKVQ